MPKPRPFLKAVVVFAFLSFTAQSASADNSHAGHSVGVIPTEPGQGTFGAMVEIVQLLESDPKTNWTRVNIAALREHLVDMSELALHASATNTQIAGGLRAEITASGRALEAVQRMVPAHAQVLNTMDRWSAHAEKTASGAVLMVTSDDPAVVARIRALGFFGLMATGAHHQAHHLAIARGEPMHGGH